MKKLIKIILSLPIFAFCLLALADVLSGGEPLIDEFIILGLGAIWLVYLIKPFKPPRFFIVFLISVASVVLHNVISHLSGFEEPFFFLLSLFSLAASVILLIVFLFRKIKTKKR